VLVPASMKLLGSWNWYLPSWLGWLPELHVEGADAVAAVEAQALGTTPVVVDLTQDSCPIASQTVTAGASREGAS
jgi:uncharacterized membrane protein YdfJ with MMPL/SSD domain